MTQRRIPAVYMRGGSSKGVFFLDEHLPPAGAERDAILLRVIGSPDAYGKQIDGMGGATSSTSKVVVIGKSAREDCDVDYLFGAPAVEAPVIDWSGNCGNLSAAVGPYAISEGLVEAPRNGTAVVRIWQANIQKRIIAHVPMHDGEVQEEGDFVLDGVAFPAAEVVLEFLRPGGTDGNILPTGNALDELDIPGVGRLPVTLLNAGNPTIFVDAARFGLSGTETQEQVNGDSALLARLESIRAHCTVVMGLAESAEEATRLRPHTPKLCFVARPQAYQAAGGKQVQPEDIDVIARILSMGRLHHAITGTGAVAVAVAAALEGTLVNRIVGDIGDRQVRMGHTAGSVAVGAQTVLEQGRWSVDKAVMSRSARRLMEGWVCIPEVL
ncbi:MULTISPECIES: 2-methylaconitate cis-trans isomerase PrpF [Pseudomonas]|uniref:2-methylaconitate cis-trans isomerase PrpF n=1 Tax=Pseudomonas TaxID=286 RepID=UPI00087C5DE6|nr:MULTISPECIES: 2-methylaconitate cis-trans isomerase PrpF [Pseudomonas]AZD54983.1 2-methylaconitate isomerase [Pseudomonas chlororaphis subsp. aurantiaca]AZD67053.1 2-methylaconitate isomerase [Pseudomonas chlororaphis subsp. aurantiaca]QIT23065.1 2-methylaconitate cis-trans isomerase PrpF [Pseudomonas chlororaphis subsp. aurantiaca]QQX61885.1 2-methylaconitate cis-trans isomerase PrpF [Pseudomonas chlororaphis subsp. aurantiaca]UUT22816.1 2-methylaconitate cis-trans isomerase PrpF [Pseudomo